MPWLAVFFSLLMSEYFNESNVASRPGFPKLVKTVFIQCSVCVCVCESKLGILPDLGFVRVVICSLGAVSSG